MNSDPSTFPTSGQPHNPGLLELIRRKRQWDWKPSSDELKKGFRGWHQRGFLPHFDAPNVTQFVTFMLVDSFPVTRRAEWEVILRIEDDLAKRAKLEQWLDRAHGECWLRHSDVATAVEEVLLERNQKDFQMLAWVIMPNHVHLVVNIWEMPLARLINDWKGKSARMVNRVLQRNGQLWQEDYLDICIRDETHLKRTIRYTELNPVKAFRIGNPRQWRFSSAHHRDKYERLPWQL
jgi:putative transposase